MASPSQVPTNAPLPIATEPSVGNIEQGIEEDPRITRLREKLVCKKARAERREAKELAKKEARAKIVNAISTRVLTNEVNMTEELGGLAEKRKATEISRDEEEEEEFP